MGDLNKPIATFDVRGYTKLIRSTKIKNCIILCTTERNWKFVCSNDKMQREWIKAFQSVAKMKPKKKMTFTLQVDGNESLEQLKKRARRGTAGDVGDEKFEFVHSTSLKRTNSQIKAVESRLDQQLEVVMNDKQIPENARQ